MTGDEPQDVWQQPSEKLQRLEFLGDAVLGLIVSEALYDRWPDASEGALTDMRSQLVSSKALANLARRHGGQAGTAPPQSQQSTKRLADRVEILIGVLFVREGYDRCREQVLDWLAEELQALDPAIDYRPAKNRLQEALAAAGENPPKFESTVRKNRVEVACHFDLAGASHTVRASGSNAREAGRSAALQALEILRNEDD